LFKGTEVSMHSPYSGSGSRQLQPHNYELFSLVKLFSINTNVPEEPLKKERYGPRTVPVVHEERDKDKKVVIQQVAVGGYVDHTFIAMALSNGMCTRLFLSFNTTSFFFSMNGWSFNKQ
jgi:hypothetical protein